MDYTSRRKYLRPTAGPTPGLSLFMPRSLTCAPLPHLTPRNPRQIPLNPPQSTHPSNPLANPFQINTCTTVSKQTTYIPPAINTYNTQFPQLPPNHYLRDLGKVLGRSLLSAASDFFFLLSSHVHDRILAGPEGFGPSERARTRFTGLKVRRIRPLCHGPTLLSGDCVYHKKV